mgnify:CR=1 FL=1
MIFLTLFKGAATALITPFKDGKIDYVSMGKLIEWQISQGSDALVVCGTTGEASTLSKKEKLELTKFTIDLTAGRVPVIAGTGGNCKGGRSTRCGRTSHHYPILQQMYRKRLNFSL